MREIKFRAWDGERKEITTSFEITSQGVVVSNFSIRKYHEDYILMQYTGLKDKNGKEIYEGDIIDFDAREWGEPHREVVEYDYSYLDMRQNDFKEWCEIIGNIYENPELNEE